MQRGTSPLKVVADQIIAAKAEKKVRKDLTPWINELRAATLPALESYEVLSATFKTATLAGGGPLKILSIDPGSANPALCFINKEYNSVFSSRLDIPSFAIEACRLRYVEAVIEHWVRMFRPEVIFKEGIAHGAKFGVAEAGRLQYIVERIAIEYRIPFITVPNMSMRAFIGATGEKGKGLVRMRVLQKFGLEFVTEDETDAYAVGETGLAILAGTYPPPKKTKKKA